MYHEEYLPNISIRVYADDREQLLLMDLSINHQGDINLTHLVIALKQTLQLQPNSLVFYLNHSRGSYQLVQQEVNAGVHFTSLISQNFVTFKIQHRPTDQLLANPIKQDEDSRIKRHPERIVEEAFQLVEQWRYFYREGCLNQHGVKMKINLQQSSQMIGVPRKTLEDYFLLFRLGKSLEFDFRQNRRERIGTLRSYIREQGKKGIGKQEDEVKFFRELRFQLLGEKQEQIFDILNRSNSSSDEDMVFEH